MPAPWTPHPHPGHSPVDHVKNAKNIKTIVHFSQAAFFVGFDIKDEFHFCGKKFGLDAFRHIFPVWLQQILFKTNILVHFILGWIQDDWEVRSIMNS